MIRFRTAVVVGLLVAMVGGLALAQNWGRRRGRRRSRSTPSTVITNRRGVESWEMDKAFEKDVFTFARIVYDTDFYRHRWGWNTDFPDSDLNFSYRLQELTSLKVHPDGKRLRLTEKELFDYPFIYLIEPGGLVLRPDEVKALRQYLLSGGFLMVDDFWGDYEWENFEREIGRVFPNRDWVELKIDHPIFHCVYDLKEKPQMPHIGDAMRGYSWQPEHGLSARDVHYRAIYDDHDRMMGIFCHNTDLGDGWEREGDNEWFFEEFSVKRAYPMGINIVFWAMTH